MFYSVIRIFYVGDTETHSVQQFSSFAAAQVQLYKNIAADLDRQGCVYCAGYVIANDGIMKEAKVFDFRNPGV